MNKKVMAFVATMSVLSSALVGFTACKEPVPNDENTLEIFISNFGYGTDWLDDMIEEFKKQDWVVAKYGDKLNIPTPASNTDRTFPAERIITDGKTNTVDLFFAVDSAGTYYDRIDSSTNTGFFEDLTELYEKKVPDYADDSQNVTFAEKMNDTILATMVHTKKSDASTTYYAVPWVNGYMGLLYNQTLVDQHLGANYVLPTTSIGLEKMAKALKGKITPFISSADSSYWNQICMTWWVQYEGTERYEDYWLGVDEYDQITTANFAQIGRLRALETLEGLIGAEKGYNHKDVNTLKFTAAQSKYILGEAVMMPNGDWFESEMRSNYEEDKNKYDIKYMMTPVISAIVENLPSVYTDTVEYNKLDQTKKDAYDAKLVEIIKVVDAEGTLAAAQVAVPNLTQADFDKVKEARKIIYGVSDHDAYIPSYATAKGLAKDFLLFMATDKACETFMRSTNGVSTAFEYDVKTKAPELYASFSNLQKEKDEIVQNGITPYTSTTSKLVYLGGLNSFVISGTLEPLFTSQNAADRKSAWDIYNNDIQYYAKNDGEYWTDLLTRAGIQN